MRKIFFFLNLFLANNYTYYSYIKITGLKKTTICQDLYKRKWIIDQTCALPYFSYFLLGSSSFGEHVFSCLLLIRKWVSLSFKLLQLYTLASTVYKTFYSIR